MNKRQIGAEYEVRAKEYLAAQGVQIIEQNYRCRTGEIDLIGYHQGYLVFIEVKYRSSEQNGNPAEAVNCHKIRQISKVSDYYLYKHGMGESTAVRYDVVAICNNEIIWYENAFEHVGR